MGTQSSSQSFALNREPQPAPGPGFVVTPSTKRQATSTVEVVVKRLFQEPYVFDFFQAVHLLELLYPNRAPLGRAASPQQEVVRLSTFVGLNFPASAIQELQRATNDFPIPKMIVNFMGLTGPMGVLPLHYTETMLGIERNERFPERFALRDWLDVFHHRLISLLYRAWEKYRFYIPYARGEYSREEPDLFTGTVFSFLGMGTAGLQNRLRVSCRDPKAPEKEKTLARIDDLSLFRFGGFLAHRPRNVVSLRVMLEEYFQVPVEIEQFCGQWLKIEGDTLSALASTACNNSMGIDAMIGDKIWDVQSKLRIRLGPLSYEQFVRFLPDRSPKSESKSIWLLARLVRLYLGLEMDVDAQLILKASDVPMCRMGASPAKSSQIGWTTWVRSQDMVQNVDDAVFDVRTGRFLPD